MFLDLAVHTRSADASPLTRSTTCNAPFGKTVLRAGRFAAAPDGRLIVASMANLVSIGPDGRVARLAGAAEGCEGSSSSATTGTSDGGADAARFKEPGRPVLDGQPYDGPVELAWFEGTQDMCIAPDGTVFVGRSERLRHPTAQ